MIVVKCYEGKSRGNCIYLDERVVCRFKSVDDISINEIGYWISKNASEIYTDLYGTTFAKLMYSKSLHLGKYRFTIEEVEEKSAEDEINERALKINFNQSVEWIKELALKVHKLENK